MTRMKAGRLTGFSFRFETLQIVTGSRRARRDRTLKRSEMRLSVFVSLPLPSNSNEKRKRRTATRSSERSLYQMRTDANRKRRVNAETEAIVLHLKRVYLNVGLQVVNRAAFIAECVNENARERNI